MYIVARACLYPLLDLKEKTLTALATSGSPILKSLKNHVIALPIIGEAIGPTDPSDSPGLDPRSSSGKLLMLALRGVRTVVVGTKSLLTPARKLSREKAHPVVGAKPLLRVPTEFQFGISELLCLIMT